MVAGFLGRHRFSYKAKCLVLSLVEFAVRLSLVAQIFLSQSNVKSKSMFVLLGLLCEDFLSYMGPS